MKSLNETETSIFIFKFVRFYQDQPLNIFWHVSNLVDDSYGMSKSIFYGNNKTMKITHMHTYLGKAYKGLEVENGFDLYTLWKHAYI